MNYLSAFSTTAFYGVARTCSMDINENIQLIYGFLSFPNDLYFGKVSLFIWKESLPSQFSNTVYFELHKIISKKSMKTEHTKPYFIDTVCTACTSFDFPFHLNNLNCGISDLIANDIFDFKNLHIWWIQKNQQWISVYYQFKNLFIYFSIVNVVTKKEQILELILDGQQVRQASRYRT